MTTILFLPAEFRQIFPAFADPNAYPDARLRTQFTMATAFISPDSYGDVALGFRPQALNLMVAHLLALSDMAAAGQGGIVIQSRVGDVQVQLQPPPERGQWRYWLNQTPYGSQLAALFDVQGVAAPTVGGLPERAAFRKVGGVFW